jgi:hypothetical protein
MTLLAETEELPGPLNAVRKVRSTVAGAPLGADVLRKIDAHWRACKYLALGNDRSSGKSNVTGSPEIRTCQELLARVLAIKPGPRVHLSPSESSYKTRRSRHHLFRSPWSRLARSFNSDVSGRHLFVSGRKSLHARESRFYSRRRRTGVRPVARLRSRFRCDGAVLPILHLNGYKINNPTLLA